jgi:hypothetical protein
MDAGMRSFLPSSLVGRPPGRVARRSGDDASLAEAWLGATHPLTVVLQGWEALIDQLRSLAVMAPTGFLLSGGDLSVGLSVAIAVLVMELVLGCRFLALRAHRRELCLLLIVEGRQALPLACVEGERQRLAARPTSDQLARSLDEIVRTAAEPLTRIPASRPLFNVRLIRAVAPELRRIASLLRGEQPCVRGVAVVEWLLTSPATPLYDRDVGALRQELGRARYLLGLTS